MINNMSDLNFWNDVFESVRLEGVTMREDHHWLEPYVPLLHGKQVNRILEIGCGAGMDTQYLSRAGFQVTATDFSSRALAMVRERLPEVPLLLHDTREPFPYAADSFDMVLGSLSLHYFDEETTLDILGEIRRMLKPKGLLLYRVNSTADHNFGAGQGDLLERNFFLQDGIRRRYFTPDSCRHLFAGWEELLLEEKRVDRYAKTKALIEGLVMKN
jgi:SAM-dependent methyltransferase